MIRREDDVEHTLTIYVSQDDLDLDHADPVGLAIGRFQQRKPGIAGNPRCDEILCSEAAGRANRCPLDSPGHHRRCCAAFRSECLAAMLHRHGHTPSWRYWLVDVSVVAHGYLLGRGMAPARTSEALVRAVRRGAAERRAPPHGSGRRCMGAALAGPDEPGRCRRARRANHRRVNQMEAKGPGPCNDETTRPAAPCRPGGGER